MHLIRACFRRSTHFSVIAFYSMHVNVNGFCLFARKRCTRNEVFSGLKGPQSEGGHANCTVHPTQSRCSSVASFMERPDGSTQHGTIAETQAIGIYDMWNN